MASDRMHVRLHLKRMKVVSVVTDEIDELLIEVADTRSRARCPFCGFKTSGAFVNANNFAARAPAVPGSGTVISPSAQGNAQNPLRSLPLPR